MRTLTCCRRWPLSARAQGGMATEYSNSDVGPSAQAGGIYEDAYLLPALAPLRVGAGVGFMATEYSNSDVGPLRAGAGMGATRRAATANTSPPPRGRGGGNL